MGCPYKNIFGAPGTGPHAYRFMGLAAVDTFLTFLIAWISSVWVGGGTFFEYVIFWFVLAEIFHYAFGVETALLKFMGVRMKCS
jgi:hypothetical protein